MQMGMSSTEARAQSTIGEEQSITSKHCQTLKRKFADQDHQDMHMFPACAEDLIQSHPESHTTMSPTPTQSHFDLYTLDLPSYTQTASIGERSIDVQAVQTLKAAASPQCLSSYKAYSAHLLSKHLAFAKAGSVRSSGAKQLQQSGAISVHSGPAPIRADKLFLGSSTPAGGADAYPVFHRD